MQSIKRIYPGGQLSPSQPLDEIPEYGKVNFRRKVLKPRKQIQTEDAISTKDVVAGPKEDDTEEEVVEGDLFKWASTICHLEDTKVKIEDLSDRNIDPGLAQSTQELLSKVLKCGARNMTANPGQSRMKGSQQKNSPSSARWAPCESTAKPTTTLMLATA